jgi:hypothetical protein
MSTTTIADKRFFTAHEANARLPLLRSILRDVTDLAVELKAQHERLILLQTSGSTGPDVEREVEDAAVELERLQEKMASYATEVKQVGAELKDVFIGLVDFPAMMDGREVCLCWKLGEPMVSHWHEVDAGFSGRRLIKSREVA